MQVIQANLTDLCQSFPIAIVVSLYNREITQALQIGALERLSAQGINEDDITLVEVPGAIEIPFIIKKLAHSKKYRAIVALGAVIRGETSHYDYVCQQVSEGCQKISLDFEIPVIFGVLTTENEEQAWARVGGEHGHKGQEAADCALAMHQLSQQL